MEDVSLNIPLQLVSNDYYYSDIAAKEYEDELRAALPPHLHRTLSRLADKSNEREAASMAFSYRFSDSIRIYNAGIVLGTIKTVRKDVILCDDEKVYPIRTIL